MGRSLQNIKKSMDFLRGTPYKVSGNQWISQGEPLIKYEEILGLPDDTQKSMQETLDMAIEINAEWANFYCTMAYPGSPLYNQSKERGVPLPDDKDGPGWIGYSQHGYDTLPLPTDTLTSSDVVDFRDNAFNKYFTHPNFLSMIEKKFGSKVIDHIDSMLKIKIKRKHRDPVIAS